MFLAETNKISIFVQPIFISYMKQIKEEFYKLKYCSTVVYMVPRA